MMKTYSDFCSQLTQQLFSIIDTKGSLLAWQKGWEGAGNSQLPTSANGLYHGANLFSLLHHQLEKGLQSNEWLTFNQIKQKGGSVKKGAKSKTVFFWKLNSLTEDGKTESKEITEEKHRPLFKTYCVFNLEQSTLEFQRSTSPVFEEKHIDLLVARLGVTLSHFGGSAYYASAEDVIVLPQPNRFSSKEHYYATLLHELIHWTAADHRVPRQCFAEYASNDKARAQEELIAEIGSVFLAIHFGLKAELENHDSYVNSWKTLLSEKEVMSAAHKAAKAFEWIINHLDTIQ
jgi:antirestriction protein ArdC